MPIRFRLAIYLVIALSLIISLVIYANYEQNKLYIKLNSIQTTSATLLQSTEQLDNNFQKQLLAWTNLLLRGQDSDHYHEYLNIFYSQERNTRKLIKNLIHNLESYTAAKKSAVQFQQAHNLIGTRFRKALIIYNESNKPAYDADQFIFESVKKPVLLLSGIKNNILIKQKSLLQTTQDEFKSEQTFIIIVFVILLFNIVAIFILLLDKYYANPLYKTTQVAKSISKGDYSQRISEDLPGEFNHYAKAFNHMINNLSKINEDLISNMNELHGEISIRKMLEKELKNKHLVAEDASKAKSEFLSTMSHELRTPLNVVTGYIELLNMTPLTDDQKNYIKSIQAGSTSLLSIINDILDFAKIESGKLNIDLSSFSIRDMLDEINDMFSLTTVEKNIQFTITTSANVPDSIISDFNRLKQILVNLLSNAIKFTDNGYVKLLVNAIAAESNSTVNLNFIVEDSGIGIHQEYLDKIFNHFEQQSGQDSRKYGGSGLGLAISKKLALLLNGDLTVKSQLDNGSTFTLSLNDVEVSKSHIPSMQDSPEIVLPPATVLIADDMAANRKLLINYLRNHPVNFIEACNGKEAVDLAKQHIPDLILMDIKMPEMDGTEASTILRSDKTTRDIPIIAISASSIHEDNTELKEALFDEYLTKPLKLNTLIHKLSIYLNK